MMVFVWLDLCDTCPPARLERVRLWTTYSGCVVTVLRFGICVQYKFAVVILGRMEYITEHEKPFNYAQYVPHNIYSKCCRFLPIVPVLTVVRDVDECRGGIRYGRTSSQTYLPVGFAAL